MGLKYLLNMGGWSARHSAAGGGLALGAASARNIFKFYSVVYVLNCVLRTHQPEHLHNGQDSDTTQVGGWVTLNQKIIETNNQKNGR